MISVQNRDKTSQARIVALERQVAALQVDDDDEDNDVEAME